MNLVLFVLAAADLSHPLDGRAHVTIVSADSAVPISRQIGAASDEAMCVTPCDVYLSPGVFAFFEGGAGSDYARHERVVWVPEGGAEIVVSPAKTWQHPLGITLLATGIPAAAGGGVLIFVGWAGSLFSSITGNDVAATELGVGIGLAAAGTLAYVIGAVMLGRQGDTAIVHTRDGRVSFDGTALHF